MKNITISKINVQRNPHHISEMLDSVESLLINAPVSGIGNTIQALVNSKSPPKLLIYVTKHAHIFVKDGESLNNMGYRLVELDGIDQFPNTPNCEWIGTWVRE